MSEKLSTTLAHSVAMLATVLLAVLIVLGFAWYGITGDVHQRIWADIVDRSRGPMRFRFLLQPIMATLAALWDGINDARSNRPPYFWSLFTGAGHRTELLWQALMSTGRLILLGLAMDTIYQLRVHNQFYPGEAVVFTLLLCFVPYLLLRGPIARVAAWMQRRGK
jgi:hypothetical protein